MMRIRFFATASLAPLLLLAGEVRAETVITDTRTTPIVTSTANGGAPDDVRVDAEEGEIALTTAGAAITVDSDNAVENEGTIGSEDVDGSLGILVQGGVTTTVTNSGVITIVDSFDESDDDNDTDDDGDIDGDFATGSGRFGIRVTGAGTVTGDIINDYGGSITIEGNDSWGVSLETDLVGDLVNRGAIYVLGDNARGVDVQARVDGAVDLMGSVSVSGENAVAVAIEDEVTGLFNLQGSLLSSGYRYTSRPTDEDVLAALDADDLLQGGPALSITASIAGGFLMDRAASTISDFDADGIADSADDDDDNDGIADDDDEDANDDGITDDDYDDDGIANSKDDDDDNDGLEDDDEDEDGVYDEDDNGDGVPDNDLDQDGRIDSYEGTGSVAAFGGSPALLIGSDTQAIALGAVGTGDDAYGFIMRGSVTASGVYDGVTGTALRIGGGAGYETLLTGGMHLDGSIVASAYGADSQAVHLAAGADIERLDNDGAIVAVLQTGSGSLSEEVDATAVAIRIDAGATISSLGNTGAITATTAGESNDAVAIRDLAGTLSMISNTGSITASITATDDEDDGDDDNEDADDETITGRTIALDLRAALQGVTITQFSEAADRDGDGVLDALDGDVDGDGTINAEDDDLDNDSIPDDEDDEDGGDLDGDGYVSSQEPSITGDVLLGAGDDLVDLRNGSLTGAIAFGDGADSLVIGSATGAAQVIGDITDSDGRLSVDLVNGELTVTNAETIAATALNVSAAGTLTLTVDPGADAVTRFDVDTASIATGAKLRLEFEDLLPEAARYTVVHATGGLTVGDIESSLDGESPYLYVVAASADTAAGDVYVDVRKRTADEMDLTQSQALALDAVYSALSGDDDIRDSFLAAEGRDDFMALYEQMLPDQGEGLFSTLDALSRTTARLTAARPSRGATYGPDSLWFQEINTAVQREAGVTAGSETKAFGLIAGYESLGRDGGALGATLAFITAEEKDEIASVGEETSVSLLEAGVYWRRAVGGWTFNARGAAAWAWLDGDRVFIDPDSALIVQADSGWTGYTAAASASLDYEARAGRYYLRPSLAADYIVFNEGERDEHGGGDGFDQTVRARTSTRMSSTAALTFGAAYGRDVWWRPELRVGYRQVLSGGVGDTVFRFTGGQWVTLPAAEAGDGAMIVGVSLRAGSAMSYFAVEGEYEAADGEDLYNLMLSGRMIF
ncbi:MAG TPA: autotransporter domain-containing protein [Caulobacter sp.]|nr:autotransporter domain-containing protein [Caulobacter sp.]